ncbi:regulator [Staphylococcus epidermidis]|uniref:transcriptional activator RinB n=1 Tax=Staphylococcus epidermidis TaxID=1282 RepID=UPI001F3241B6|nr:transcriptional activator RinB [Staphylococcus epidermidis]MCE5028998.1 regulator [Staphylococcus epidermidis]MCE5029060.1 regulator [Staphylococcus epidermidis]
MIKRILKIWFTIAIYEVGKWIGRELYYKMTANDEVEVSKDFYHKNDQIDIENYV